MGFLIPSYQSWDLPGMEIVNVYNGQRKSICDVIRLLASANDNCHWH